VLIGAAVWPRGGAGEIRRIAVRALRSGADDVVGTVDSLGGVPSRCAAPRATARLAVLFENTFSQYRTEPGRDDGVDWMTVLGVVRRLAGDSEVLLTRHPEVGPLPWPPVAERVDEASRDVAGGYRQVAGAIEAHGRSDCGAVALIARLRADPPHAVFAAEPVAALRALDAWGWLHVLAHDLDRIERAVQPDP
jgi:hypothetical protein